MVHFGSKKAGSGFGARMTAVCIGLFALCAVWMLFRILPYHTSDQYIGQAVPVTVISSAEITVNGETREYSLPAGLEDLTPGTEIQVSFSFLNQSEDTYMQVRTAFAPLRVEVNGETVYEFGSPDTRPSFMKDPGTVIQFVPIPDPGQTDVVLHYTSPTTRDSVNIATPFVSNQSGLLRADMVRFGPVMGIGLILLIGGILLILIAILILQTVQKGRMLLYLGAFTALTGLWGISNCDMVLFYVNDANLWYLVSYMAFFSFTLPLEMFLEKSVYRNFRKFFHALRLVLEILLPVTVILQLTGTVMFIQSAAVYRLLLPVSILLYTAGIIGEAVRYRDPFSMQMTIGMLILSGAAVSEIVFYMGSTGYDCSARFLIGTGVFCIYMCGVGALQIRKSWKLLRREKEQERQLMLMNLEIHEQKKYQDTILEHEELLRRLRHDYRHQLTVLQGYVKSGNLEELSRYLSQMMDAVPVRGDHPYTENTAVNAVVSYYTAAAQKRGARTEIRLTIPRVLPMEIEQSLCVILGNLMENACEAIGRMGGSEAGSGKPDENGVGADAVRMTAPGENAPCFLQLSAVDHMGTLVIHMENSMGGRLRRRGRFYVSEKRDEIGIGLGSISSIAGMYGGDAEFHGENGVFVSNVYMHLSTDLSQTDHSGTDHLETDPSGTDSSTTDHWKTNPSETGHR